MHRVLKIIDFHYYLMEIKMRLKGYVYVIGNDELGVYKIGYSRRHPQENRLHHLQVGSPVILRIAATAYSDNAPAGEKRLHQQFSEKHVHYEWFRLSPDDIRSIGVHFPPVKPIKPALPRTLSRQEAKVVLTMEEQKRTKVNRTEIIALLGSSKKAADNVIESLRRKKWLERVSWGRYRLIPLTPLRRTCPPDGR